MFKFYLCASSTLVPCCTWGSGGPHQTTVCTSPPYAMHPDVEGTGMNRQLALTLVTSMRPFHSSDHVFFVFRPQWHDRQNKSTILFCAFQDSTLRAFGVDQIRDAPIDKASTLSLFWDDNSEFSINYCANTLPTKLELHCVFRSPNSLVLTFFCWRKLHFCKNCFILNVCYQFWQLTFWQLTIPWRKGTTIINSPPLPLSFTSPHIIHSTVSYHYHLLLPRYLTPLKF